MRHVRKGWLFGYGARPVRIIQDTRYGNIFRPGDGGWRRIGDHERVVLLPRRIMRSDWPPSQWWLSLWRSPEWAWLYGAP